jgi:hypothetical protein
VPKSVTTILLLLLASRDRPVASQITTHEPQALRYEHSHLAAYTNTELIDLLSRSSIELSLTNKHGMVSLVPSRALRDRPRSFRDSVRNVVNIPITADSSLSYLDDVVAELVRRRPYSDLLNAFASSLDFVQQTWIVEVLAHLRSPEADSALKVFATEPDSDYTQYLALKYFAESGASWALAILNCHYFNYPVSSLEWSAIVTLFGEYRYYPAGLNLANTLNAALVNLGDAAEQSLIALYPEAHPDYHSPEEASKFWMRYVKEHQKHEYARTCMSHD